MAEQSQEYELVRVVREAIAADEGRSSGIAFDAIDWMALLKTVTKENWPTIRDAIDAMMAGQRLAYRVMWAMTKRAIEAWLGALGEQYALD